MIQRSAILSALNGALRRSRVVVLIGPRQCGKTTLARQLISEDSPNYFDLEDPVSLYRLDEPMTALRPLEGLIVIDEIQRRPFKPVPVPPYPDRSGMGITDEDK